MNLKELQERIRTRQANKTEEDILREDEDMLMASYLSEIEKFQKAHSISRKDLAATIKTSASYLTQVFRGDKPLNFYTIAKIQRALNIRFRVITIPLDQHHSFIDQSSSISDYASSFNAPPQQFDKTFSYDQTMRENRPKEIFTHA